MLAPKTSRTVGGNHVSATAGLLAASAPHRRFEERSGATDAPVRGRATPKTAGSTSAAGALHGVGVPARGQGGAAGPPRMPTHHCAAPASKPPCGTPRPFTGSRRERRQAWPRAGVPPPEGRLSPGGKVGRHREDGPRRKRRQGRPTSLEGILRPRAASAGATALARRRSAQTNGGVHEHTPIAETHTPRTPSAQALYALPWLRALRAQPSSIATSRLAPGCGPSTGSQQRAAAPLWTTRSIHRAPRPDL